MVGRGERGGLLGLRPVDRLDVISGDIAPQHRRQAGDGGADVRGSQYPDMPAELRIRKRGREADLQPMDE
jgi:hypothetical protein